MSETPSLFDTLERLAALPHRASTHPEERQAAQIMKEAFEAAGLEARFQPFRSYKTFSWIYAILYGAFALAAGLGLLGRPGAGVILFAVTFALFYGEITTRFPWVGHLLPKGDSQNVLAHVAPSTGKPSARIVITAHYDTSRSGMAFSPQMARHLRKTFLLSLGFMGICGGALLLRLVGWDWTGLGWMLAVSGGYFLYGVGLMFEREIRGILVNGANDNGSGSALLAGMAARLAAEPLANCEVVLAATGCEEVGMEGMKALMHQHAPDWSPERTYFLNFDNVGAGQLHYIIGEGVLHYHPAGGMWVGSCLEVAGQPEFRGIMPAQYRALTLDSLVAAARGYPCMSLMALDSHGVPPNWHWPTDVIANVDRPLLEKGLEFAEAITRRLDRKMDGVRTGNTIN